MYQFIEDCLIKSGLRTINLEINLHNGDYWVNGVQGFRLERLEAFRQNLNSKGFDVEYVSGYRGSLNLLVTNHKY